MEKIIEKLLQQIEYSTMQGEDNLEPKWRKRIGVLISTNEARQILAALEGPSEEEIKSFIDAKPSERGSEFEAGVKWCKEWKGGKK